MAISNKLDYLLDTKQAIKQAIIDKGQEVADTDTFRSYAEKIEAIEAGGAGLEYNIEQVLNEETGAFELRITDNPNAVKDMLQARVDATNSCAYLFHYYPASEMIDISRLNTSNVTDMRYMFGDCTYLTTLDLSNFDTSNATNMYNMFSNCQALTTLDLSSFDTSKVTSMGGMFKNCSKLTSLDLSSFDTNKVYDMNSMFSSCKALTTLDLSSFDTSKVTSMSNIFYQSNFTNILGEINIVGLISTSNMFSYCYNLTNVTLKNIKINLQLGSGTSWGHLLSMDSLTNTINELWDMTGSTAKTLTIGTANLEKLANVYVKLVTITDEMRAEDEYVDNKKPCVVCESTDEGAMLILDYARNLKNWNIS